MYVSLSCMFYYEEEMQGQAAGGRQSNRGNISGGEVLRDAHGAVGRSFDRRRLKKKNLIFKNLTQRPTVLCVGFVVSVCICCAVCIDFLIVI